MAGIDPAFPADYSYAELTKWVITNPSGIKVRSTLATFSIDGDANISAAADPDLIGTPAYTSGTTVICSKCHDLENFANGDTAYHQGSHGIDNVVGANTAHSSHHQDQTDGSPQCVNCHIDLPHGWVRPRLLVNTAKDAAPYLSPDYLGTTRTNNGVTMYGVFNKMGMQTLAGEDEHTLNAGGAALWTEADCDACNDHAAEGTIEWGTGKTIFPPAGSLRVQE